jgi:lysophospholipase L1-like esterase
LADRHSANDFQNCTFEKRRGEKMRIPQRYRSLHLLLLALTAALCLFPLAAAAEDQHVDFSRFVVVGDSLSAGFQSGSLIDTAQVHGYANVVAEQAHAPLILPLISPPGIPPTLELQSFGPPPVITQATGLGSRLNPTVQVTDLAVPGAKTADVLNDRPATSPNGLNTVILGLPGLLLNPPINRSQIEWAEALHPTFTILWIGSNDVLGAALAGTPALATPVSNFAASYDQIVTRLAATGSKLTLINIVDVTLIPAFTSAEAVAEQTGIPLAVLGPILGIHAGDLVTPNALPLIQNILTGKAAGPLPGTVVLDVAEQGQIRAIVDGYNAFIAAEAKAHGAALVDEHTSFAANAARGVEVRGQRLTVAFLGGLFSLDGVHPTNTGYALTANDVIKAINRTFDADIEPVSVEQVARQDPLVPPRVHDHDGAFGHVTAEQFESVRRTINGGH